jgi:uncharacterized membrane protein
MIRAIRKAVCFVAVGAAVAVFSTSAQACAACFGRSNSEMAKGLNWGIFVLMLFIVGVLGTIAACFFRLARRMAAYSEMEGGVPPLTASNGGI